MVLGHFREVYAANSNRAARLLDIVDAESRGSKERRHSLTEFESAPWRQTASLRVLREALHDACVPRDAPASPHGGAAVQLRALRRWLRHEAAARRAPGKELRAAQQPEDQVCSA